MLRTLYGACAALCFVAALAPSLAAHENDPKTLPRNPPYRGRGALTGAPQQQQLPGGSGPAYLSFPNNGIRLMSWLSLQDLNGGDNGNSCWGYTSPSGREYACFGSQLGTHFVEVTDPANPNIVAFIDGPDSLWRDVRTYQNYAYTGSEGGGGVQVIDLAGIDSGVVTLVNTVTVGGNTQASHTIVIDEASGFLYRAGGGSHGIRIYSLANPAAPAYVSSWDTRYVHEATIVTYTSGVYAGKQIAFLCSGYNGGWAGPGLDIVDVTNKANLIDLSHINYSGAVYSHQCWPTPDMHYLYLDDELDEYYGYTTTLTKVFDITNLSNPIELPGFGNGNTAIGHNLYTKANRIYQANYTSGLRICDSTVPTAPVEIAYFDTYPENDANVFNSLWNVYAYFASGTIIGSDIDRGLFVWWAGNPLVGIALPAGAPTTLQPVGQQVDVTLTEAVAGNYQAGSATLHMHTQANGWQSSALSSLGGLNFRANFPALACGTAVQWYVTANSTNGFTWTEPAGAPGVTYVSTAALSTTSVASYDFEAASGWTGSAAGDNASAGQWTRGDPSSTTSAQSEDDHSDVGYQCWYTGSGADVDGGKTTLVSPTLNLAAANEPYVRYWRWFSNNYGSAPASDVFTVAVSNNNGSSWTTVETVGPTGQEASSGWYLHQFRVADFVTPSAQVKLRFVAQDLSGDSEIEAAVDDLEVLDLVCATAPTVYCAAKLNSQGCSAAIGFSGIASVSSPAPFAVTATNVINQQAGTLFYGFASAATPFQGGTRCVHTPLARTPLLASGGNAPPDDCSGAYSYDFNARIDSGVDTSLVAGATVFCQFWYRDGADPAGFGTGLSNALQFSIDL